jgi:hypothetical protein
MPAATCSERRAGPEKDDAEADPFGTMGKAAIALNRAAEKRLRFFGLQRASASDLRKVTPEDYVRFALVFMGFGVSVFAAYRRSPADVPGDVSVRS